MKKLTSYLLIIGAVLNHVALLGTGFYSVLYLHQDRSAPWIAIITVPCFGAFLLSGLAAYNLFDKLRKHDPNRPIAQIRKYVLVAACTVVPSLICFIIVTQLLIFFTWTIAAWLPYLIAEKIAKGQRI